MSASLSNTATIIPPRRPVLCRSARPFPTEEVKTVTKARGITRVYEVVAVTGSLRPASTRRSSSSWMASASSTTGTA
ncbi:UNVERIFIED_ORG: hypothetical protein GGE44_001005 [Rhizobium esperanzae]